MDNNHMFKWLFWSVLSIGKTSLSELADFGYVDPFGKIFIQVW